MTIKAKPLLLSLGVVIQSALMFVAPAQATLGEAGDSVSADGRALSAAQQATREYSRYTVREIRSDSVTVREYISPSDVVFGVAWSGMAPPDLDQLLGTYAGEYRDTLRTAERKPGNRSGRKLKTSRAVVETWGHMRDLQGRAYVPALIPQGVAIHEIK